MSQFTLTSNPADSRDEPTSLIQFCDFVEFFTRHASDPLRTTLVCEQQAEVVRIAPQDVTLENMHLLLDTLLTAMDHLEKKWLDEQIRREEMLRTAPAVQRRPMKPQRHALAQWAVNVRQRLQRKRPAPRQYVAA